MGNNNIFKELSRKNYLAIVTCVFIMLVVIAITGVVGKLTEKSRKEWEGKVFDLQNQILVMDTTASQDSNNVVINNTGFDNLIKSQNDQSAMSYLTNAITFTDHDGYMAVRESMMNSLSETEVLMLMPQDVALSDALWQSDLNHWSLQMNGFESICTSCDNNYSYVAYTTLDFCENGTPTHSQNFMMTYDMDREGNMSNFTMNAVALGGN